MHDKHPRLMYLAQKGRKKNKPKSDQVEHLQEKTLEMK
jgi:hypothetical protein